MPIRFKYDPGAIGGLANYAIGRGKSRERAAQRGAIMLERERERQAKYQSEQARITSRQEMADATATARSAREARNMAQARLGELPTIPEHLAVTDPSLSRTLGELRSEAADLVHDPSQDWTGPDGASWNALDDIISEYNAAMGRVQAPDPMAGAMIREPSGEYRPVQAGEGVQYWSRPGQPPVIDQAYDRQLKEQQAELDRQRKAEQDRVAKAERAREKIEDQIRGLENDLNKAESEDDPNEKRVAWLKGQIAKEQEALATLGQAGGQAEQPAAEGDDFIVDATGKVVPTRSAGGEASTPVLDMATKALENLRPAAEEQNDPRAQAILDRAGVPYQRPNGQAAAAGEVPHPFGEEFGARQAQPALGQGVGPSGIGQAALGPILDEPDLSSVDVPAQYGAPLPRGQWPTGGIHDIWAAKGYQWVPVLGPTGKETGQARWAPPPGSKSGRAPNPEEGRRIRKARIDAHALHETKIKARSTNPLIHGPARARLIEMGESW